MKSSYLRIGSIGSGGRGRGLAMHAHSSRRRARIVACCDVNPDTLAMNKRDYGDDIFVTHDYRKLLELDLDAVIISTPDFPHEE